METPGEDVVVRTIEPVVEGGPSGVTACPNCGSDRRRARFVAPLRLYLFVSF